MKKNVDEKIQYLLMPEDLYPFLLETGYILIVLSANLSIKEFNKAAEKLYRCKKKDVLNKNFIHFCKDISVEPPINDFSAVFEGKSYKNLFQALAINHSIKHLQWTIMPLLSPKTKQVAAVWLIVVNTSDYYAESNKNKLEYYKYIIDYVPHYLFWKNKDSVFMGCNKKFAESAGLTEPDDIIGKTDYDLPWKKEESDVYRADDQRIMLSKQPRLNIEESQTISGKKIVLLTSKVPLFDDQGEVTGVLGIYSDITDRKQMEEDLKQSTLAAEAASRAKSIFLANMSHDIKTPISGIINTAEYLSHIADNQEIKDRADDIVQSGLHLLELMIEIIEVSRLELRENRRTQVKFQLKQLINDIFELIKPVIVQTPLKLQLIYDEDIPNFLVGDRWHLYRILLNLLSNAIKFTAKGGITVQVQKLQQIGQIIKVKISIEDTGIGLSKEKQTCIFNEFTRLTPAYEGIYKGTGLGLYIVKQFIEAMHGEIHVKSEEGKGSTFTCIIPFKVPVQQKATSKKDKQLKLSGFVDEENHLKQAFDRVPKEIRILLVEDNVIASTAIKGTLQSLGCYVDIAKNGIQAISFYKQKNNKYDLVFLDLGLPDMDGIQVAQKIREIENLSDADGHSIPIFAISAHVDNEIKMNCLNNGVNDVLTKPLLRNKAKQILHDFLRENMKKNKK